MLHKIIRYFLHNRIITIVLLVLLILWGLATAPFNWKTSLLPRDPVAVDAIPDIGENQQIVATQWTGRSPKDIQEQITYPLTTYLLGIPGVKTIRSTSMFGMSFIYIIFDDKTDFYWSRSRILEKLNSLPAGTLPEKVQPALGPDATALGQIFWYTLEGRNPKTGKPNGGWNPDELRTLQDFQVKYGLASAQGVSEVASIGGYVKEYQVEVRPEAMKAYHIPISKIMSAIQKSNIDIGAETIEMNNVEYLIRGLGYIKNLDDLKNTVIASNNGTPVRIGDVAYVHFAPATRRGGLDKDGAEAVGGVVVARYGSNPMQVIQNVKEKIKEVEMSLPQKTLSDGTVSKVSIVPFYDRSGLIRETVGTLQTTLSHEILICIIVVIFLVLNLRASIVISSLLPIAVLTTFILMRYTGVEANIVALSGIAIAIGVMVDAGMVFVENIIRHMDLPENKGIRKGKAFVELIYTSVSEVAGAMFTAMLTTIISFLPVFAMQAQEGKLFKPLAYTKTFAILSALLVGIGLLPTIAYYVFSIRFDSPKLKKAGNILLVVAGIVLFASTRVEASLIFTLMGINNLTANLWRNKRISTFINVGLALVFAVYYLTKEWLPVGPQRSLIFNYLFIVICVGLIIGLLWTLVLRYRSLLHWCLDHRIKFISIPIVTILWGIVAWIGFAHTFGFVADGAEYIGWKHFRQTALWQAPAKLFPGIGSEFMPSLDEGSFLLMPSSMPHTGISQNIEYIHLLDKRISAIPEVESCVGKWGRAASALDPAPVQMFENTINYRSEYLLDKDGQRERFKVDKQGAFVLKNGTNYNPADGFRLVPRDSLLPDANGKYLRQWRPQIKRADDIWQAIIQAAKLPGLTSSPKLQPIAARLVMLSTGMRAPMGLKISGPDDAAIEKAGKALEAALKKVRGIQPSTVYYDRALGSPYLEIKLDRVRMARYGIQVADLQKVIGAAVGGETLTTTVEGRLRFPVNLRYPRELRDSPAALAAILIPTANGTQIPLGQVTDIGYTQGAQMIKSENTFPIGYVTFDKQGNRPEVEVIKEAQQTLQQMRSSGQLELPQGVSFRFAGSYEQQQHAAKRLLLVIPLSLLAILLILYFRFKSVTASLIHFSGVIVAFSGGFILLWLYAQPWFLNLHFGGTNLRDIFQIHPINLSIAVWVGFIALFGIATNDGVLMGTYIHDIFLSRNPETKAEIRQAVVEAGLKRVRPAAMTTATALIALLCVLSSNGKGSDIMVPMAIPAFGGMLIQSMTMFVVPVLQCWWRETVIRRKKHINV